MNMKKILVANRGEIALRVMRSAREMSIKTVAVFSDADRNAPHVKYADQAIHIGAAPSAQSYLVIDKIIEACKTTQADAVHPGYGFLSENAEFARRLEKEGIILIGPSAQAMEIMGDKLSAKAAVKKYNIPMVPGTAEALIDVVEGKEIARSIGYPILIKASAGGGGKGMRIVHSEEEFEEQMKTAISEATSAFGNGSVFIERYVASPRHIEVQILADKFGNIVYLFDRECSVQRRHQKVIEEAPAIVLTPALRKEMGEAAVNVARSCNYLGAGTVEFLYENGRYYFLEMNTRLQVEHPVTEFITDMDLVKEQIKIARGEALSFKQEDLKINGHAIEVRVYAENSRENFMPDIGKLITYKIPQGNGVRLDDGYAEGMEIPIYYDPMIAKLITHGKDRQEAIERMLRAISEYKITGLTTTLSFGKYVMENAAFREGNYDTHFIEKHFNPKKLDAKIVDNSEIAALVATHLLAKVHEHEGNTIQMTSNSKQTSLWRTNRL
jgi:acetyl-CoA carboxylase biotin carboxylase subunit